MVYWHRRDFWCELYSQDMYYEINFRFRKFQPRMDLSQIVWLADKNKMIRRLHFILQIGSFDSVLYYFMSMNFVVVIKNEFCCCFEYLFINRFYFHLMKYIWISNDVAYTFRLSLRFRNKINIFMKILSQKRWKH